MLEQFEKSIEYYCRNDITAKEKHYCKRLWKMCCSWVLEKAGENINLIDFMQEIANEAGVTGYVTKGRFKFEGGIVDSAETLGTPEDQDREAAKQDAAPEYIADYSAPQEMVPIDGVNVAPPPEGDYIKDIGNVKPVDVTQQNKYPNAPNNAAKDCVHVETCNRACQFLGHECGPAYLQDSDSHVSVGWVPCQDYEKRHG